MNIQTITTLVEVINIRNKVIFVVIIYSEARDRLPELACPISINTSCVKLASLYFHPVKVLVNERIVVKCHNCSVFMMNFNI